MKRYLAIPSIAAVALCLGPVQAMDYEKCEAMQKALERVTNSRDQWKDIIWRRLRKSNEIEQCGPSPDVFAADYTTEKQLAWYDCTRDAYGSEYDNLKMELQKALGDLDAKVEKIQADYEKEGCY